MKGKINRETEGHLRATGLFLDDATIEVPVVRNHEREGTVRR